MRLGITRRPITLGVGASASVLNDLLARQEKIRSRAGIYRLSADRAGALIDAVEMDFTEGFYRSGPVDPHDLALAPGWSFSRPSTGRARTAEGVLRSFAADQPRITSRGLLIEAQRTNLARQSAGYASTPWATSGVATIASDAAAAPDGTVTADLVTFSSGGGFIVQDIAGRATSETGARSFFAKKSTGAAWLADLTFYSGGVTVSKSASFNLDTLTGTNCILREMANGWVEVILTLTNNGTGNALAQINVRPTAANTAIYLWGEQYEVAGAPSSPITTTTATATRAADNAMLSAPADTGTLIVEWCAPDVIDPSAFPVIVSLTDEASALSAVTLYQQGSGAVAAYRSAGGVAATTISAAEIVQPGQTGRAALRFTRDGLDGLSVNGGPAETADGVSSAYQTEVLRLGTGGGGLGYLNSTLRRVLFLPKTYLSDAELAEASA